jgi:hypothetical protein
MALSTHDDLVYTMLTVSIISKQSVCNDYDSEACSVGYNKLRRYALAYAWGSWEVVDGAGHMVHVQGSMFRSYWTTTS